MIRRHATRRLAAAGGYDALPPLPTRRRVVVTAMGAVTPMGHDVQSSWQGVLDGRSSAKPLADFKHYIPAYSKVPADKILSASGSLAVGFVEPLAGPPASGGGRAVEDIFAPTSREARYLRFAFKAAEEAMSQVMAAVPSGRSATPKGGDTAPTPSLVLPCAAHRFAVNVGVGMPSLADVSEVSARLFAPEPLAGGPQASKVSPFFVPKLLGNMVAGQLAIKYGLQGPCLSNVSACATGAHCIGEAARLIERGDADAALCGATESAISPVAMVGFHRMKAIACDFNHDPQKASRPFDARRCGFVMAEGCGLLVLEEREAAMARGATILAELRGYAASGDAHHISTPRSDFDGVRRCIESALASGGVDRQDVAYVNAHATGTPVGDEIELAALASTLTGGGGGTAGPLIISSSKGALGHLLGAAGSVEAIMAIKALQQRTAPPNVNLETPVAHDARAVCLPTKATPLMDRRPVVDDGLGASKMAVMSTSFGFGGTNAALIFTD